MRKFLGLLFAVVAICMFGPVTTAYATEYYLGPNSTDADFEFYANHATVDWTQSDEGCPCDPDPWCDITSYGILWTSSAHFSINGAGRQNCYNNPETHKFNIGIEYKNITNDWVAVIGSTGPDYEGYGNTALPPAGLNGRSNVMTCEGSGNHEFRTKMRQWWWKNGVRHGYSNFHYGSSVTRACPLAGM